MALGDQKSASEYVMHWYDSLGNNGRRIAREGFKPPDDCELWGDARVDEYIRERTNYEQKDYEVMFFR